MLGFDPTNPPFDRLSQSESEELTAALDIAYFRPDEPIVRQGAMSDALHVIVKGRVEVRDSGSVQAVLGPKDSFDSRAVVHGAAGEDFVAREETLCHLVPKALLLDLIRRNAGFAAFFYGQLSEKLEAAAEARQPGGMEGVLRARVRDARIGAAIFVDGSVTLEQAGHRMRENDINSLFVRDGDRIGVVTGMNLSKAAVLRRLPLDTPVRNICHFDVIAIDIDDFIFEALITMTRHDRRRLAVRSDGAYIGFLEDIDILGLFAGNPQLIPGRIDRARGLEDLGAVAGDIQAQVERLHRQGIKVDVIADITSDLNRRLFSRLFDMLAPPSIREHGCLMLMGSEGRGEQTIRTDQDNGLLLGEPVPEEELDRFRWDFSGALDSFGFPPCPGEIMVRNPVWSQPLGSFRAQLRNWVISGAPESAMNLAIFADAVAVAGQADLLATARFELFDLMRGETGLLARFANLIEAFETPALGVLNSLMASVGVGSDVVDVKRAGIFPIVHGARTLAIDKGILSQSTASRIEGLVDAGSLEPPFAAELIGALRAFMEFRLRSQLDLLRGGRNGAARETEIRLDALNTFDRDILRDALRIVRQFRNVLRTRYNLGAF